jgi:hypothetical protein
MAEAAVFSQRSYRVIRESRNCFNFSASMLRCIFYSAGGRKNAETSYGTGLCEQINSAALPDRRLNRALKRPTRGLLRRISPAISDIGADHFR